MNAGRFARNVEQAYREMWRRWCRRSSAEAKAISGRISRTGAAPSARCDGRPANPCPNLLDQSGLRQLTGPPGCTRCLSPFLFQPRVILSGLMVQFRLRPRSLRVVTFFRAILAAAKSLFRMCFVRVNERNDLTANPLGQLCGRFINLRQRKLALLQPPINDLTLPVFRGQLQISVADGPAIRFD